MNYLKILFFLSLTCKVLFADVASIVGGIGGTVFIENNQKISMKDESIKINAHKFYIEFEIVYNFVNTTTKLQKITMGFPHEGNDLTQNLFNFKAFVDGQEKKVVFKSAQNEEIYNWYSFDVEFQPSQTMQVKNTYWVYPAQYSGLYTLGYILQTGASWLGNIDNIDIKVKLDQGLVFDDERLKKMDIVINPKGYKISEDNTLLTWNLLGIEPNQSDDLEISYIKEGIPYMALSDSASSTYMEEGENAEYYGAENLLDDDLTTAWGSGNEGKSIGEWVKVVFADTTYNVKKIGIFPGRSSDEGFVTSDHLKSATLIFSDGSKQKIFFENIPKMQYFDIKERKVEWIQLTIDEVYEGLIDENGYKGTVYISEMKIY